MHRFANPGRFLRIAGAVLPWSAAATVLLLLAGFYLALVGSPPDYQQGEAVRIMYVHVPAAWMALLVYVIVAAASASALVWRHPLADLVARAASPIGAAFTFLALVTGSLWGKPMWGAWWVWDARLTSVLVLFFLYLGHIALGRAFDDRERGAKAAALLAIVGLVNIPIIHFSVLWWNTLHQPASVFRMDGPTIAPAMLWPLFVIAFGYMAYFVTVLILVLRAEIAERKLRIQRLGAAATPVVPAEIGAAIGVRRGL
jgi:heme exporter protein C